MTWSGCKRQEAAKRAQDKAAEDAKAAQESVAAAQAAGTAEVERMRKLLTSSAAEKAELEAKVARAAGALKAADELREMRWECLSNGSCNRGFFLPLTGESSVCLCVVDQNQN